MQAIGADNQIEKAFTGVLELNAHTIRLLLDGDNLIAENDLGRALDLLKQQPREFAAPERHEAPTGQLIEHLCAKSGYPFASLIDNPYFTEVITDAIDLFP